jgi:DNA topoisomerase-1
MASLDSLEPIAGDVRAAYVARGRTLTVKGWKSVFDDYDESDKDEDDDLSNPVPQLDIGAVLSVDHGNVVKKSTRAPGRYSQSTLVKELEALGIGRPSTYAAIVHKIIDRGYVLEDKKGFLSASMAAETIVDSLVGTFEFVGLDYTRSLEDDLDEIANGHKTYLDVVAAADRQLSVELSKMGSRGVAYPCPSCGKAMRRVKGPKVYFWSCGAYPGCRTTLPDEGGKPGVRQEKPNGSPSSSLGAPAGALHVCPACSKPLRRKTLAAKDDTKGKGWDFWGCTGYPACRKTFNVGKDGFPDFSARSTT